MSPRLPVLLSLALVACGSPPAPDDAGLPPVDDGPIAADDGPPGPPLPAALSEAGLYAEGVDGDLADGVLPYEVRYPLWSDGADKARYLRLPDGGVIDVNDPDHWAFPVGTRVYKEFRLGGRLLETRLLWKVGEGPRDWASVSYALREDGTDGDPVPDGQLDTLGTNHDIPSQGDCLSCHQGGGDFVLGIGALQLARATFDAWVEAGVLPDDAPWEEPPGEGETRETLGMLHGNCGHCHNDIHPLANFRPLRLRIPVELGLGESPPAWATAANGMAAHEVEDTRVLIVPGDPQASQVYRRMAVRSRLAMPPLGTEVVDEEALGLVERWILAGAD